MGSVILRVSQKLSIILIVILPVLAQQIEPPTPSPEQAATLTIHAVEGETNVPVPNIAIELNRASFADPMISPAKKDDRRWSYTVTTGDDGTATVEVMPDRYISNTSAEQWGLPVGDDRYVTVEPGDQDATFLIRLTRASSVSGRVEDEDGNPLEGISVELLQESWIAGNRQVTWTGRDMLTDKEGQFAFAGILPGGYLLIAAELPAIDQWAEDMRNGVASRAYPHASTFYPNTVDVETATVIRILPGIDQPGLRITMPEGRYYTVSGRVDGLPDDAPLPTISLQRMSGTTSSAPMFWKGMLTGIPAQRVHEGGTFTIPQVAPGPYTVNVGKPWIGGERIYVSDEDVEDVRLLVSPSLTYTGSVSLEDGTSAGVLRAWIEPFVDGARGRGQFLDTSADGTFQVSSLRAGVYRIHLPDTSDLVIKTVRVNDREFPGGRIELPATGDGTMDILVSRTGAGVAGTVQFLDSDQPNPGSVTIAPEPVTPLDAGWILSQVPNETGGFRFPLLEVGTYRVCAWNDRGTAVNNILNSPRFEPKLKRGCKVVELDEEDSKQVQLKQLDVATFQ